MPQRNLGLGYTWSRYEGMPTAQRKATDYYLASRADPGFCSVWGGGGGLDVLNMLGPLRCAV